MLRVCVRVPPPPVHPPLYPFPTSFPLARARTRERARIYGHAFLSARAPLFVMYVYDVHCCKLLPYYGHVPPTGLIEDPLELP